MAEYTKNFLTNLYKSMLKIRLCEESFIEPILQKRIKCPVHLYSGQEAIAVGVCAALTKKDYIFGTHRSHGHYLAKRGNLKSLVAEIYGKKTGCCGGRGGSMHICEPDKGILGAVPIVGGTIPLALGCALASRIKKEKNVTVSFFGDGATGEGVLYESLNFAALKKLPIIFACENNLYSTHMPIKECRPQNNIFKTGILFGITSLRVDGNNVLKVYETAKKSAKECRNGSGPVFIEFMTYRLHGHVGPDDTIQGFHVDIRPKTEIEKWRRKDPIKNLKYYLIKNRVLSERRIAEISREIETEVKQAHIFADKSPYPRKNELKKYVFKA